MTNINSLKECRRCYNHIGGKLATTYFSYLLDNHYIYYKDMAEFNHSHHLLPMIVSDTGYAYFKQFGFYLEKTGHASACLDGTEKKPHLAGKIGSALYNYFINNKLLFASKKTRALKYTQTAHDLLIGDYSFDSDLI